jgi:hypothetical protein
MSDCQLFQFRLEVKCNHTFPIDLVNIRYDSLCILVEYMLIFAIIVNFKNFWRIIPDYHFKFIFFFYCKVSFQMNFRNKRHVIYPYVAIFWVKKPHFFERINSCEIFDFCLIIFIFNSHSLNRVFKFREFSFLIIAYFNLLISNFIQLCSIKC